MEMHTASSLGSASLKDLLSEGGAAVPWIAALLLTVLFFVLYSFRPSSGGKLPPGPYAWPLIGSILSIRQPLHAHLAKLSIKHGPLIFLKLGALRILVANDAEMAREVLKVHDVEFANRPRSRFFELYSMGYKDMMFSDYGEHWRKLRRISSTELFSPAKLWMAHSSWESSLGAISRSIEGRTVDIGDIAGSCTSKIICDMIFGEDAVDEKKLKEVFHTIEGSAAVAANLNIGEVIPALDFLDLHGSYRFMANTFVPRITAILREIIRDRRSKHQTGDQSSSVLDTLLLLKDDNSISDDTVMTFLMDLISAGTETSHTVVDWAMAEMLANPELMRKAQEELDRVVGKSRRVRVSDLSNLPYIQAIFKETVRVHSVAPLSIPHFNHNPVSIRGYTVPAKCHVLVNIWAISRDPAYWPEAEVFKPERFLEKDVSMAGQDFNLIPFSAGRRICSGYPLAMSSTPFILATLVHAFDWEAQGKVDLTENVGSLVLGRASKLIATAHPRLDPTA